MIFKSLTKVSLIVFVSTSLFSSTWPSVITFRSHPVSWLASFTFWPPLPIAWESFSSSTAISILFDSSSITIDKTAAGDIALITNWAGLSSHKIMSILSPAISFETDCTLEPLIPTQAPTGSSLGSLDLTAIFALTPGSLAALKISIKSWPTSGTSKLKSLIKKSECVLDKNNWGPFASALTSFKYALILSPFLTASLGIKSSFSIKPSVLLPKSINTPWCSTRLTIPIINSPTLSSYDSTTLNLSASLTFCTMTCLAVCAAILPNGTDSISSSIASPISISSCCLVAYAWSICASGDVNSGSSSDSTVHLLKVV